MCPTFGKIHTERYQQENAMSRNEVIRSTDEELRKADELLRLRGSSLDKVLMRTGTHSDIFGNSRRED